MSRYEHVTAQPGDFIAKAMATKRKWIIRRSDVIADFIETLEQGGDNRDDLLKQAYENPQVIDQWFKEQWYDFAQIEKRGVLIEGASLETIAGLLLWADGESGWPELTCVSDEIDFELPSATNLNPEPVNQQLLAVLKRVTEEIQDLMSDSEGVAGFHRNGDIATWGELEAGGRFERLSSLPEALAAIAAAEAAQCRCQRLGDYDGHTHHLLCDAHNPPSAKPAASAQPVAVPDDVARAIACVQDMWNQLMRVEKLQPVFVTPQDMRRWSAALSVLEALAAQQPASAQPVAVPELRKVRRAEDGRPKANYDEGFDHGWNDCVHEMRAMLSAAQKTEGGE